MHGPTPSVFSFTGFLAVVTCGPLELQAHLLRLRLLGVLRCDGLARPWCSLVKIMSVLSDFGFFAGGSAPSSLGVLMHACFVCTWRFFEQFLSAFRVLPGAFARLSPSQGDPLR